MDEKSKEELNQLQSEIESEEEESMFIDKAAKIVNLYRKSPSSYALQKIADNLMTDNMLKAALKADDRNVLMRAVEKYTMMDPRNLNPLYTAIYMNARYGIIDVDEELLQNMRDWPGLGVLDAPELLIDAVGVVVPGSDIVLKGLGYLKRGEKDLSSNIRNRAKELRNTQTAPNRPPEA